MKDGGACLRRINATWKSLRARHSPKQLARVGAFLETAFGRIDPPAPDAMREVHPRLYFPGLTAQGWHDDRALPRVLELEAGFGPMRREALRLLSAPQFFESGGGVTAVVPHGSADPNPLRGVWRSFFFHRSFKRLEGAGARCPLIARALEAFDVSREAMLSVLEPGTHIRPHTDRINFILTAYLPLSVPEGSYLKVAGEARHWREGRCFVADTTFFHESWNGGAGPRTVLIADFWHPELTDIERSAVSRLLPEVGSHLGMA